MERLRPGGVTQELVLAKVNCKMVDETTDGRWKAAFVQQYLAYDGQSHRSRSLSFPKIISARSKDATQTEQA